MPKLTSNDAYNLAIEALRIKHDMILKKIYYNIEKVAKEGLFEMNFEFDCSDEFLEKNNDIRTILEVDNYRLNQYDPKTFRITWF
jgi:beta-galactosidase/beta-glucuronidase